jgi:hypothetical protein
MQNRQLIDLEISDVNSIILRNYILNKFFIKWAVPVLPSRIAFFHI